MPIHLLRLPDGKILSDTLNQSDYNATRPNDQWEYAVGVEWKEHFELSDAKTFKGVFANQNVVCKLTDIATVRFVRKEFQIADQAET
jgi:hypothetical protein